MKGENNAKISYLPTLTATVQAVAMGLFIPMISSILPIQSAMSKSLNDSLNATRSKTKG